MKQRRLLAAIILVACVVFPAAGIQAADSAFRDDTARLSSAPSRLTGTAGGFEAAKYVEKRLREIGADEIIVQPFSTVQTRRQRCELIVEGAAKPIDLLPMRPNGIIPPSTPPEGITGPIVHAGAGAMDDLMNTSVRGAIVVLDYNAGTGWMRAFRLGARAVIFVPNGTAESMHSHTVAANANLPRYYYNGRREDLPAGKVATIHSEIVWDGVTGRNVFGFFAGSKPSFSEDDKDAKEELVIVAAKLDSFGEVPDLSPGARGAANCAALLKLAERFKKNRPRRHVLVAFFDGQSRNLLGSGAFYRVLEEKDKRVLLDGRRASLKAEREHLKQLQDLLATDEPLEQRSPVRKALLNGLRDRADDHAFAVNGAILLLGNERVQLQKKWGKVKDDDLTAEGREAKERIRQIDKDVKKNWLPEKERWNTLRRALGKDDTAGLAPDVREKLRGITGEIKDRVGLRSAELKSEDRSIEADRELKTLIGKRRISLHASLMLGDTTERWGVAIGGDAPLHSFHDNPAQYGKIRDAFLRGYKELKEKNRAPARFVVRTVDGSLRHTRALWAVPKLGFVHGGEVAGLFGIYNVGLATCQERLPREGTPHDTIDRLDLARMEVQADEIGDMLTVVMGRKGLSAKRGIVAGHAYIWPEFDSRVRGSMVMGMLQGSSVPNTPMAGAVVQVGIEKPGRVSYGRVKPYAFDRFQVVRTSQNGTYSIGPAPGFSDGFAAVFDERGMPVSVSDSTSSIGILERLNVFRCWNGALVLPPQIETVVAAPAPISVMSARSSSVLDSKKSFVGTGDGVVFWWAEERVKGVKLFGLKNLIGLNSAPLASDDSSSGVAPGRRSAQGRGLPAEGGDLANLQVTSASAGDLWRLNESRLAVLRERDIRDSSIEELHGRAEDLITAAGKESSPLRVEALTAAAFYGSQPVYTKTRAMLDDLVVAVLILLALSVPFTFSVERMVIGATTIYKQIGWFAAFFAATFVILYLSHPAFAIANTPIIIFLGFAIVVMSVVVIAIIMQKFEVELKALQGMASTVHAIDVSRVSTFIAAMHMGISTMRRRPLRTALTAGTIILLTFTILCFASFGTQLGIITLFSEPSPPYSGVLVHRVDRKAMSSDVLDMFHGRWRGEVSICRREWICPEQKNDVGLLLSRHDGSGPRTISGVLGLQPDEIARRDDLRAVFGDGLDDKSVLLTRAAASDMKVKPGDTVILHGRSLRVDRLLDPLAVSAAKDMDGSNILPVNFTEVTSTEQAPQQNQQEQSAETMLAQRHWTSLASDRVAVVSANTAHAMGADLYAATLYTGDTAKATEVGEDLARVLPFPVAATRSNGVYLHVLGTTLAASGVGDLFFPILLGGLVIFGTMLGSVADREREIYTFSALGLAPRHVATLFFAESMVYSLVGGMGGYLLAQGSLKILTLLAGYGVSVPEINMSSTNTMVTILIVMATVLVSAIYPAIKASKSANPGLMRSWRAPDPDGDVLDIVFPFTVSEYDITGVVSFLKEHFDSHSDTGLGRFMARETRLVKDERNNLGLDATVALAPFDLGVSQTFAMRSAPSEIAGIDEVQLRLERLSGRPKDWRRLNKVFLDDLRRQFLIWRSISQEAMEGYRQQTLTMLGAGGGQAEDGQ